tara:strand:- start:980 stop:1240 length:261 start_codon:yes stop_codon:yes gene_type:complete
MTTMLIDSEHDMEHAIAYTTHLVKTVEGVKNIAFSFPSRQLSQIFLDNLTFSFHENKVSPMTGLHIDILIPEDNEHDGPEPMAGGN